jgi:hypothetical protein
MKEAQLQKLAEQLERHIRELGDQEGKETSQRMSEELIADAIHCLTAIQLQRQSEEDYRRQFPERYRRLEQFFFTPEELLERRMERTALRKHR